MEVKNTQQANLKEVYSDKVKKTKKEKNQDKVRFSKIRNILKRMR